MGDIVAVGLLRSCPVCFSPKWMKCTRPTDTTRVYVDWFHHKREEPLEEEEPCTSVQERSSPSS